LNEDEVLLIAGKGHEITQIIGSQVLPFSDIEIALDALI
jgi:UDP-N-acetylmuramoyl-L-alanyl-D-glutamate--2,6-diaminopimelate ligase